MFAAIDDVSREAAEAERKFATEIEERANEGDEPAKKEKCAAEFAKRVHEPIIAETLQNFTLSCNYSCDKYSDLERPSR